MNKDSLELLIWQVVTDALYEKYPSVKKTTAAIMEIITAQQSHAVSGDVERVCQQCGGQNPTWYADNELFNKVNGSPNGIICPSCFEKNADEMGVNIIFQASQT